MFSSQLLFLLTIMKHDDNIYKLDRKYIIQFLMSTTKSDLLILVYYRVRGKLQPVRNLLFYLGLAFVQVHWQKDDLKKIPEQVIKCLKGVRIDKQSLPLLVFEGLFIYDIYPIMAYLCRRFEREDLLGTHIRQKTRLQEILEIYFLKQPGSMTDLFKLADFAASKSQDEIIHQKKAVLQKYLNQSGYIKEICVYLEQQKCPAAFVLGSLTILDFLFLETCHYMLGMFNNIDQKRVCPITNLLRGLFECSSKPEEIPEEIKHIQTMRNFVSYMTSLQFYENNKNYLESFSIICSSFHPERVQGLKKIWVYNKLFVQ